MCKSQQNKGYPLSTSYCFFFIVSRLFPFVTTQSSNWYGKLSLFFVYSTANFEVAQGGFPSRFLPRIFPAAPNQHRLFCDLRQEPGNTGPHLLPSVFSHIHSKTACRGFKSFCPCHKTGENTGFSPVFFLHVLHCYLVHFGSDFWVPHPSVPAAPLSSTQNAPGFAFFGLFRVRFRIFRRFVGAKFSDWFLCILPYSDHRLKPSVIPCRREVSFLT